MQLQELSTPALAFATGSANVLTTVHVGTVLL